MEENGKNWTSFGGKVVKPKVLLSVEEKWSNLRRHKEAPPNNLHLPKKLTFA